MGALDQKPDGAVRRLGSLFGPVVIWAVLAALAVGAWMWTGRQQRGHVSHSLGEHARVAAGFTNAYLDNTAVIEQQDASRMLNGPTISQQQLELFSAGYSYSVTAILDAHGRVMVLWPARPGLVGRDLTRNSEHVRLAVRQNRIVVSDVYTSVVVDRPLVAIVTPFPTAYGRRIFYAGFDVAERRLDAYLHQAAPDDGHAYYVDRSGDVAAATIPMSPGITPLSELAPKLARALSRRRAGVYRQGDRVWQYTSAPVGSTGWRLVIDTSELTLMANVDESQRVYGAVLLVVASLGLVGAMLIGIARERRRRSQRELFLLNRQYARQAADLRAANAELESFSYSVAHDLRAPLRAMSGYAQILIDGRSTANAEDPMPTEEANRLLGRIQANAAKMAELIDALLWFSRLQRHPIRGDTVHLTELARAAWDTLAGLRSDRDIQFRLAELPPCHGDTQLLQQVLTSLLDNAIKFTRDRPTAHIEVGATPGPEGFTTYYVKDDGAGFDPAYAAQLFRPFHRLHRTSEYEGIGVGLSLVERIITRHGGRISAESVPGQGTTISFSLPTT